jgi:hypothetical protein
MSQTINLLFNSFPFENRYKTYRILNYGKPYSNYKSYNIKYHPENKTNILAIYVDNQSCNNIPTNKSLLSNSVPDENTALLQTSLLKKYYVEIHYTPEENKPNLEYIMTDNDINDLISKYDFGIKI